jgi:hypothetical protein
LSWRPLIIMHAEKVSNCAKSSTRIFSLPKCLAQNPDT